MKPLKLDDPSSGVADVPGFETAGVACGIRGPDDGRLDLALVYSPSPCSAAGLFTRNAVQAAPVRLCCELLEREDAFHGVVVNSGNANACTGVRGMKDAETMGRLTEEALGVRSGSILVCSTGRIGRNLPMDRVAAGIREVVTTREAAAEASRRAAEAILTSDTCSKTATVRFEHDGETITVSGMAKGAGMIEPNMATMLAFLATDLGVSSPVLRDVLDRTVPESYNAITVDGDMSTNDTVLMLANGRSGLRLEKPEGMLYEAFLEAVRTINHCLADKIVSDGEKITKVVEVVVRGAATAADAEKAARTIGNSLLVKSSWYGEDPNWGRLAAAAGASGAAFDPDRLDIYYGDVPALVGGVPEDGNRSKWEATVRRKRFAVRIDLHAGDGAFRLLSTDLTEGYVKFNRSE